MAKPEGFSCRQMTEKYRASASSSAGAHHERNGIPNQDAYGIWPEPTSVGPPLALAIGDGHGGAAHFRADFGSRFAVQAGEEAAKQVLRGRYAKKLMGPEGDDVLDVELPRAIVKRWRALSLADLKSRPIKRQELENVPESGLRNFILHPEIAYGSTLTMCGVSKYGFLVILKIGDGQVLTVSRSGRVDWPFGYEDTEVGDVTDSLCSPNAWQRFDSRLISVTGEDVRLVMATTDGFIKQHTKEAVESFARRAWQKTRDGASDFTEQLRAFTDDITCPERDGVPVRDDTTIGLLYLWDE